MIYFEELKIIPIFAQKEYVWDILEGRYKMKITKIWFKGDYFYGEDENGKTYRQSLLWYKNLGRASDEERANYTFGYDGIH